MGVLLDLVVSGSGTITQTLSTILQLCGEMKESQDVCQRLRDVFDELKKMEMKKRLSPSHALDKYVAVVSKTLRLLERYRGKKLVFRLMKLQAMMEELRVINEDIDVLVSVLTLANTDKWKQQFEDDRRVQQELLASSVDNAQGILAELQDARSQQETMLTLKYEVEQRPAQKSSEMAKLLKSMTGTVIRASMTTVPTLPPWFLPPYEIHFNPEPFDRGSFATVHRGVWGSDTNVVVKCFLMDGVDVDERTRQNIEAEMNLWHQFNHPNVIKLLGASHISTPPFVVCEDATNGDLHSFLARSDANKQQMWTLLYQAALGLDYIHKKSAVHGDLKLNNILVGADGQAKLSDFGLSAVRTPAILCETTGAAPYTAGALRWRAPECLTKPPTFASDVYSFAMCMIEAVIGEPPFAFLDDDSVHEKLRSGEIPERPEQMSTEVWELVVAMMKVDPEKRVSLSNVLTMLKTLAYAETKKSPQNGLTPTKSFAKGPETANSMSDALLDVDLIVGLLDNIPSLGDRGKERALLQLAQTCVKDEERPVVYEANGVPILTNLVKNGRTYYTKLYALQCLKWATSIDSKLSKPKFDELRDSAPDVPAKELAAVVSALKNSSEQEKQEAATRCACIAARGNGGLLRDVAMLQPLVALWQSVSDTQKLWVGMVQPLVSLMQSGNNIQKLWATEAIGNLVVENEVIQAEISRADAITPLVMLLRTGTNGQKHRAVYALQNLLLRQNEANQAIVQKGAIDIVPLIALARLGTIQQKQTTTALMERLVRPKYANRADIERETAITPLFGLILVGTDEQKETAAVMLLNLAVYVEIRADIVHKGGVTLLVALLRDGTNPQKGFAAGALTNLAFNDVVRTEISREGGITPLVELVSSGNDKEKEYAVGTLANLSLNDAIAAEIARNRGVAPLVEYV